MPITLNSITGIVNATWTTATRPVAPTVSQTGYNTTLQIVEYYDGTQWMTSEATRRSDQVIQSFLASTTFVVPAGITNLSEVLVVAGGGSGGHYFGGGGGAGGVIYQTNFPVTPGASITVTIGAGGAAKSVSGIGNNGGNSVFGSLTAIGGGGGGNYSVAPYLGQNGGSGGGGSFGGYAGGSGTIGQGYDGGPSGGNNNGSGGGGATSPGLAPTGLIGGNGGLGINYSISGISLYYAGGGGGAGAGSNSGGSGGIGGGGDGGNSVISGVSGIANTGGGGGGVNAGTSGAGGSGIVIIKY